MSAPSNGSTPTEAGADDSAGGASSTSSVRADPAAVRMMNDIKAKSDTRQAKAKAAKIRDSEAGQKLEKFFEESAKRNGSKVQMKHDRDGRPVVTLVDGDEPSQPRIWKAADLRPAARMDWLAKNRLVRSAVNLLVGDEGIGKSLFWVWIVAALTTGRALPEFGIRAGRAQHVLLVVTEDDWSTAVLPRLLAAGADLGYISVICAEEDGSGAPVFPRDIHLVVEADPRPALIVVDAWLDTVAGGLSVRDPQQARQALHPWREAATATGAAVLLLTHTNRVASGNARDKYGATGELRKKARITLFAQTDDEGRLLIGPEKSNVSRPIPSAMFMIESAQQYTATEDDDGTVPRLVYVGDSEMTAREHITEKHGEEHDDARQDRAEAVQWLREYLEINPDARSAEVKREAKKAGISERTLHRARKPLKVQIRYIGSPPISTWSLPISHGINELSDIHAGHRDMTPNQSEAQPDELARVGVPASASDIAAGPAGMSVIADMSKHTEPPKCVGCGRRVASPSITRCNDCRGAK